MTNQDNEMKKFVDILIQQLQASGIQVSAAALLSLDDKKEDKRSSSQPPLPGQIDMGRVNDILKQMRSGGFPAPDNLSPELDLEKGDEGKKVKCYCPNCYNFDTFESVHAEEGSKFDYGEVMLNGSKFKIKYHISANGKEDLIIKKDTSVDLSGMGLSELQAELTKAVQEKNFILSQQILNEIQERKNKN